MKQRGAVWGLLGICLGVSVQANAGVSRGGVDEAPLDRPYQQIQKPLAVEESSEGRFGFNSVLSALPVRSDFAGALAKQTAVRSQGSRGTCSIFSATAWLEGWLRRNYRARSTLDLSEEWLEYLVARETGADGSDSLTNFQLLSAWGSPREALLPYLPEEWESIEEAKAAERCGDVKPQRAQKTCLIAHWDPAALDLEAGALKAQFPELHAAALEAARRRAQYGLDAVGARSAVRTISEAKRLLAQGVSLTLDLDFFYGAWNHREADELGIGRNLAAWARGEVGYPEPGSLDLKLTKKDPAGHSVLVVGYDDEEEMHTRVKMADGTEAEFTYRGVYYFKNSWGVEKFGKSFEAAGLAAAGYGRISQKYAHEYGGFYRMSLPESGSQ